MGNYRLHLHRIVQYRCSEKLRIYKLLLETALHITKRGDSCGLAQKIFAVLQCLLEIKWLNIRRANKMPLWNGCSAVGDCYSTNSEEIERDWEKQPMMY